MVVTDDGDDYGCDCGGSHSHSVGNDRSADDGGHADDGSYGDGGHADDGRCGDDDM